MWLAVMSGLGMQTQFQTALLWIGFSTSLIDYMILNKNMRIKFVSKIQNENLLFDLSWETHEANP